MLPDINRNKNNLQLHTPLNHSAVKVAARTKDDLVNLLHRKLDADNRQLEITVQDQES